MALLKRGSIIRNRRTGRYVAIRRVWESFDSPGHYWVNGLKIKASDGVAWGQNFVAIIKDSDPLPIGYEAVKPGTEPATIAVWRDTDRHAKPYQWTPSEVTR